MTAKTILGLAPTMTAMATSVHSYNLAKKKNPKVKDFLSTGVTSIVGINMTGIMANEVAKL